jgi:hypothetical protein
MMITDDPMNQTKTIEEELVEVGRCSRCGTMAERNQAGRCMTCEAQVMGYAMARAQLMHKALLALRAKPLNGAHPYTLPEFSPLRREERQQVVDRYLQTGGSLASASH